MRYTKVKIRKPHTCESCYRKFEKGHIMLNFWNIYEGDQCYGYICETCSEIIDMGDGSWEFGEVKETLEQGMSPEGLLSKLKQEKWERTLARIGTLATKISSSMTRGPLST